jgi:hypothetical protein
VVRRAVWKHFPALPTNVEREVKCSYLRLVRTVENVLAMLPLVVPRILRRHAGGEPVAVAQKRCVETVISFHLHSRPDSVRLQLTDENGEVRALKRERVCHTIVEGLQRPLSRWRVECWWQRATSTQDQNKCEQYDRAHGTFSFFYTSSIYIIAYF